jgi:hypothetical protein
MEISPNLGRVLLALYLIIIGISGLIGVGLGILTVPVSLLALVAGGLLLLGR